MTPWIVTLGESLIDFVADEPGSLVSVGGFRKAAGGAPANVAACVARLGGRSAFVGKRGNDAFGEFLEATLRQAGVDTRWFTPLQAPTGLAFVALDHAGQRDFVFYRHHAADTQLAAADVDGLPWGEIGILHVGSVSLAVDPARTATLHAVDVARRRGIPVSFDVNWRPALWPDPAQAHGLILDVLSHCDILKVNEEELRWLTGQTHPADGADALHQMGPWLVLITLGAEGAWYSCRMLDAGGEGDLIRGHVPAPRVPTVDTTGAGDAFIGAFLTRFAGGVPVSGGPRALRPEQLADWTTFAVRVAALTTTRRGAIPALPSLDEVEG